MESELSIRPAKESDTKTILFFIKELANYERAPEEVVATENSIRESMFGERKYAYGLIAEQDGKPLGFAVYFFNYSTWLGRPGLYLEDLYVNPESRGLGIGRALLKRVAQIAVERNCSRFEWSVLDWNEPSIKFYEKIGAVALKEWVLFRLSGPALLDFASP